MVGFKVFGGVGLEDLPADARTSGAIGYVNKDELSPRAIRRIWEAGGDPAWAAI